MSTRKKVYVLYSLTGDIVPKVYKTKASLKPFIDKQPNLRYYEFLSLKEAEEYVNNVVKKNQWMQNIKVKTP